MTTDKRSRFALGMMFALSLMLSVSNGDAAAAAEFKLERKASGRDLLKAARVQASRELADLKAELSRATQKRLAAYTFDSEVSLAKVAPVLAVTRVAASAAIEEVSQTR